jgi:hypothetical protein
MVNVGSKQCQTGGIGPNYRLLEELNAMLASLKIYVDTVNTAANRRLESCSHN